MTLHTTVGLVFLGLNLVLAAWAFVIYRRRQTELPSPFWSVLWITFWLFAFQAATGILFLLRGLHPRTPLHFLYVGLAAVTVIVQIVLLPTGRIGTMFREEGRIREPGMYASLCLLAMLFALRLWMTGALGF